MDIQHHSTAMEVRKAPDHSPEAFMASSSPVVHGY